MTILIVALTACAAAEEPVEPEEVAEEPVQPEEVAEEPVQPEEAVSFEGETLRFIVGFAAGGGFDTAARIIADRLPAHLPGEPNVIVQNMPGAASMVAANTVYGMQPGDGRTLAMLHFGVVVDQILGVEEALFDAFDFEWIGESSGDFDPVTMFLHHELGIDSVSDLRDHGETVFFGSANRGAGSAILTEFLEDIGWPLSTSYGWDGTEEIFLAIEARELDAISVGSRTGLAHPGDSLTPLASLGTNTRLANDEVPDIRDLDLGFSDEDEAFLEFLHGITRHLRLFALPPGTPPERVEAMRDAFEAILTDPEVMDRMEALGIEPGFTSGTVLEETVNNLLQVDPALFERHRQYAEE